MAVLCKGITNNAHYNSAPLLVQYNRHRNPPHSTDHRVRILEKDTIHCDHSSVACELPERQVINSHCKRIDGQPSLSLMMTHNTELNSGHVSVIWYDITY